MNTEPLASAPLDFDACYRASSGRDARLDGSVYLGVTSTGIYCKPSCPARLPKPENCRFFPSAAACVAAGFRACKRCRPDAIPGTRDWDARGDLVARAVRRIREGAVDAIGVAGLASELAVSERHLRRMLIEEVGASPLQLARTRRAHAARALIEETELSLADVAFAAGFGSVRQFGDTIRREFGITPSKLRGNSAAARPGAGRFGLDDADSAERSSAEYPVLPVRLRTRAPFDAAGLRAFLIAHAVPGRDAVGEDGSTSHAIDVPGGTAVARIDWDEPQLATAASAEPGTRIIAVPVVLTLPSLSDVMPAIQVVRRMLDLDADPAVIEQALGQDPVLAPLLARRPGLRLPGVRNPAEFALGVVLGQQVSLAAARTLQGRLAATFEVVDQAGPVAAPGFLARPDPARIAALPVDELRAQLGLTGARAATISALATALAAGLDLGVGADRDEARETLGAIRGIGPWTVELVAMRSLGDPDAYPAGDLILHRAVGARTPKQARDAAEPWRPFRGYATQHLWANFLEQTTRKASS